uniref:Ig-like domain-containing protein n=1 Tax=Zonotrichia albicollis TaxID=44394 RepID=A0A8D2QKQ2_ZONAL
MEQSTSSRSPSPQEILLEVELDENEVKEFEKQVKIITSPEFSPDKKSMVVSLDVLPLALLEQAAVTEMPPRFAVPVTDIKVAEGLDAVFECVVTGTPVPVVQWFRGDACATPGTGKYVVSQKEGLHSLKVKNVGPSDSGLYRCQATNRLGEGKAPVFLKQISDVEVWQGDVARLSVSVTGSPTPKIQWFFNGRKLTPCMDCKLEFAGSDHSLILPRAGVQDEGEYRCVASSAHGETSCSAQLRVRQRQPGSPCFARQPGSVLCAPGSTAVFEYTVEGRPRPDVLWSKGSERLLSDARRSIAQRPDGSGSLTEWHCVEEDSGLYTCRAVSALGEATSVLTVTGKYRPSNSSLFPQNTGVYCNAFTSILEVSPALVN